MISPYPKMPQNEFQASYDLLFRFIKSSAETSLLLFNLDISGKVWDYESLQKWIKENLK